MHGAARAIEWSSVNGNENDADDDGAHQCLSSWMSLIRLLIIVSIIIVVVVVFIITQPAPPAAAARSYTAQERDLICRCQDIMLRARVILPTAALHHCRVACCRFVARRDMQINTNDDTNNNG